MKWYFDVCDKTNKHKSKKNQLKSLSVIQYGKCFRINHSNENPNFFDVDKLFNNYITNHKKM